MKKYTFGFIGFGLIGGSIAKALKNKLPDCTIYAYMRSHIKLEMAKEEVILSFYVLPWNIMPSTSKN